MSESQIQGDKTANHTHEAYTIDEIESGRDFSTQNSVGGDQKWSVVTHGYDLCVRRASATKETHGPEEPHQTTVPGNGTHGTATTLFVIGIIVVVRVIHKTT